MILKTDSFIYSEQFVKVQLIAYLRDALYSYWSADAEAGWEIALTGVVTTIQQAYEKPQD